jgi:hypothetical protein
MSEAYAEPAAMDEVYMFVLIAKLFFVPQGA